MALFPQRLKNAWYALTHQASATSDLRHPTAWLTSWALGGRTSAGIDVSPASAMTLSSYFGAVRAISEDIAKLPLITYRRLTPRGKERALDHPVYPLLHDAPNAEQTAMAWRETLMDHALTWGNGYSEIIRQGGRIVGFGRPIHPSRVEVKFDEDLQLVYDVRSHDINIVVEGMQGFETIRIPQADMLHIHGLGSGITGYSVAQLAAESLGLSLAAQQFGATFFGNGTNLSGVLTHPAQLSDTALAHLRDSWTQLYGGPESSNKPAILEEGMTWERIGVPPEDAQFLETREFQVSEVARWFRIPPHKIAHMKEATFSNIEHQAQEYVVDTLTPWAVRWEQELKRKVFMNNSEFFAEHLFTALLRGDQQARSNFYRTRFYIGSLSPNDIRELENENPILDEDGTPDPAGDMYYIQNNLATLATIAGTRAPVQTMTTPEGEQFALVPIHHNGHTAPLPWDDT